MKVLVINCGSSSIKYKLYDMETENELCSGLLERVGSNDAIVNHKKGDQKFQKTCPIQDYDTGIKIILENLTDPSKGVLKDVHEIGAVGHRVVHGAETFSGSQVITQDVVDKMTECIPLAPLHNPPNLAGIEAFRKILPGVKQCGVFDTAFHQTMEKEAYLYAIPYEFYEKHRIRRYGFHGTSHLYVSHKAAQMLGKPYDQCKIITCHLGNGCSIAAIKNGKSVDTSMGMTPLEGLVMGTRCGDLDPQLPIYFMDTLKMDLKAVDKALNKQSGLLGICNFNDSRDVEDHMAKGDEKATLAFNMFCRRLKKYIGSYAAIMGGVDAVVFTAGIGENSDLTRYHSLDDMEFFGIKIDKEKNHGRCKEPTVVSTDDSKVKVFVIPTNEELVIARDTKKLVEGK